MLYLSKNASVILHLLWFFSCCIQYYSTNLLSGLASEALFRVDMLLDTFNRPVEHVVHRRAFLRKQVPEATPQHRVVWLVIKPKRADVVLFVEI